MIEKGCCPILQQKFRGRHFLLADRLWRQKERDLSLHLGSFLRGLAMYTQSMCMSIKRM